MRTLLAHNLSRAGTQECSNAQRGRVPPSVCQNQSTKTSHHHSCADHIHSVPVRIINDLAFNDAVVPAVASSQLCTSRNHIVHYLRLEKGWSTMHTSSRRCTNQRSSHPLSVPACPTRQLPLVPAGFAPPGPACNRKAQVVNTGTRSSSEVSLQRTAYQRELVSWVRMSIM